MAMTSKSIRVVAGGALLVLSVCAQARLVVVQDDEAQRQKIAAQEHAKLNDEREALEKQQAALQAAAKAKQDKRDAAKVQIDSSRYQVVADLSEKIIHNFGVPPKRLPARGGAALSSPLWASLNAIAPRGWRVYTDKNVDPQTKVSWNGAGKNWVAILYDIGMEFHFQYEIDWNQRVVLVNPRKSVTDKLEKEMSTSHKRYVNLVVEAPDGEDLVGDDGVLVINGKAIKVKTSKGEN